MFICEDGKFRFQAWGTLKHRLGDSSSSAPKQPIVLALKNVKHVVRVNVPLRGLAGLLLGARGVP